MKHIYAVKDLAVQAYGLPFFVRSRGEALRSFQDEVNGRGQPNSAIQAHPEDYELYDMGTYDEQLGQWTHDTMPILVARALDLITEK